jgi:hypothetical protein
MRSWGRQRKTLAVEERSPQELLTSNESGGCPGDDWSFLREQPDHDAEEMATVRPTELSGTFKVGHGSDEIVPGSEPTAPRSPVRAPVLPLDKLIAVAPGRPSQSTARAKCPALLIQIEQPGREISRVVDGEFVIGRSDHRAGIFPELDLHQDPAVSRRHARLFQRGDLYYIQDFRSTNGTRLNDRWLEPYEEVVLEDGDRIDIGDITQIHVLFIGGGR